MISCLFHQSALRRHLDDGWPLSARTQSHLDKCSSCREMLEEHSAIIQRLNAKKLGSMETPAFLHTRIMNGIRADVSPSARRSPSLRWAFATVGVAVVGTLLAVVLIRPSRSPVAWPELKTQLAFKSALPANPLETEIENLRGDALNAAKALAASFLPTESEAPDLK